MKLDVLSEAGIFPGPPGFYRQQSIGRKMDPPEVIGGYTFTPVTDGGTIWYYEHKSPLFHSQNFKNKDVKTPSNEFHADDTFGEHPHLADWYASCAAKDYAEKVKAAIPGDRRVEIDLMVKYMGTYYASIKLYP